MPEMILISVDLPAPLSPTSATTSPANTLNCTPSSAWTAPNRLLIPWSSSSGVRPPALDGSRYGVAIAVGGLLDVPVTCRLLDRCRLADGLVALADLGHRVRTVELVLDDGVGDRLGGATAGRGDRDRGQQDGRHVDGAVVDLAIGRRLLALEQRARQLGGLLGLGLDRLVHGHVLLAAQDPLDRGDLGVLAGDRPGLGIDPGGLHRGDRAARGAVVGAVRAVEPVLADR